MDYVVIGNGLVGYHVADQLQLRAEHHVFVVTAHPPVPPCCEHTSKPWPGLIAGRRVLWCVGTPRPADPVGIPTRRARWDRVLQSGALDGAERVLYLSTAGLWGHPIAHPEWLDW